MRNKISLVILLVLLTFSNAIFISLDNRTPYCFYKNVLQGQSLLVSYIVSGINEEQIQMTILSENREVFTIANEKDYSYDLQATSSAEYSFCFTNLDGQQKILAFEFMDQEKKKEPGLATKGQYNLLFAGDVDDIISDLKKNIFHLEIIYRNQHFQEIRDDIHAKLIQSTDGRVKWCSFLKIAILVIICAAQIYILTSFFRNKRISNV